MRKRHSTHFVLAALAIALALPAAPAPAATYKADAAHSTILFKAKHLNTGYVFGRFNSFAAQVNYDESKPEALAVEATVQVDSIDTGNTKRDSHLKSPDFFSAKEFPAITFKSKSARSAGENKFEVAGDLTLHGVTKPVTVTVEKTGASTKMGERVGWLSTFTVKRSDFGMTFMPEGVSDEIELIVSMETVKG
jgi:polyisoprenoid-binding protein YceI